ncbi:MAG: hypothetical protein KKA05_10840, partial [Alphaproteobacteria bacterium]|nr:hypothetical protein [Alphaproteobacteria bacterium]
AYCGRRDNYPVEDINRCRLAGDLPKFLRPFPKKYGMLIATEHFVWERAFNERHLFTSPIFKCNFWPFFHIYQALRRNIPLPYYPIFPHPDWDAGVFNNFVLYGRHILLSIEHK